METCTWENDNSDFDCWETGCGNVWQFLAGGPKDNRVKFCLFCGNVVEEIQPEEEECLTLD